MNTETYTKDQINTLEGRAWIHPSTENGAVTVTTAAEALGVTKTAITAARKALIAAGLLTTTRHRDARGRYTANH